MQLPISFPSDAEVIREEVARFRALTPEARRRSINDLISSGNYLMKFASKPQFARQHAEDQERLARDSFLDFVVRYGSEFPTE